MKWAKESGFLKLSDLLHHSRLGLLLFLEMAAGVVISLALAVVSIKLATKIFSNNLQFMDEMIINLVYSIRSPQLTQMMAFITDLGADWILVAGTIATIFLAWDKNRKAALLFFITIVMGAVINILLKNIIQRPRPLFDPLITVTSYSFPSGHAMNSLVFYAMITFYIYRFTRSKLFSAIVSILCLILTIVIGFSRVYLGVHYPSDILAGYIVGGWWFVTVLLIEKTLTFWDVFKEVEG